MIILADTHAFLWLVFGDLRLSKKAEHLFSDVHSRILLSIASLWELAIKERTGKINLGRSYTEFIDEFVLSREVEILGIGVSDLKTLSSLPLHHRDPFDRLLISQGITRNLPIITDDPEFKSYAVKTLW